MAESTTPSDAVSSGSHLPHRLRIIAAVLMALGIALAEVIYWRGTRAPELPDDPSLLQNEKAIARQAGILYGNQAVVVQQWSDTLKRPGVEAGVIIAATALLSGGCFYLARLIENDPARQLRFHKIPQPFLNPSLGAARPFSPREAGKIEERGAPKAAIIFLLSCLNKSANQAD